ncbi:TrmH family RNA methyltransferase [Massilia sp. W12]|uniref:TrmH family RNA methyltransferase n=1 Tax=Massilia sp. W12 TaxID=3126507 RepID=UPI0030D1C829
MHTQLEHHQHQGGAAQYALCILAHDLDDPMNIGSLFRMADALGVAKIYLSGSSPTPPHAKIKRTSRSAEKYVAWEYAPQALPLLEQLRRDGWRIVCLEITSASIPLREFAIAPGDKICLIPGSENSGVCQTLLDAADVALHIPMQGQNSSMNVATACAIAAYDICGKLIPGAA